MPKVVANNAEKLRKKFIQEQQKRIKPGECQKYIRAVIDENVLQVCSSILSYLTDASISHVIKKQKCDKTIVWERNVGQQIFNKDHIDPLCNLNEKYELETQLLRIFNGKEFHDSIEDKSIHETLNNIKHNFPGLKITLLVVGVLPRCNNTLKRETSFAYLQILYECSIIFVKDTKELTEFVARFTKSVAEIPFKKQRSELCSVSSQFLLNDNKDCVHVDGSNGLGRLWQQHLNRLPQVTLDVAQTILNKYPCPKLLLDEFEINPDGPTCLANLRINRGAVPLTTERRIGEVLSKKLYTLYTSVDPKEVL